MFKKDDFIGFSISDDEYNTVLTISIIDAEPEFIHIKNLYKHSKLFNYRLFKLYTEDCKFAYYAMRLEMTSSFFCYNLL